MQAILTNVPPRNSGVERNRVGNRKKRLATLQRTPLNPAPIKQQIDVPTVR